MKKRIILLGSFFLIVMAVFSIHYWFRTDKLSYVVLGDSVAEGRNPYGEIGYSYADFLADSLKKKGRLKSYTKEYAKSGYVTTDVITDIHINQKLKKELRESDLVTISIGANDFLHSIDTNHLDVGHLLDLKKNISMIMPSIDECIKELRKYAKEKVIIVGYYNPIPFLFNTSRNDLDLLFAYIDDEYQKIADQYQCTYVSLYQLFKENTDFLPNPADIHPNLDGYRAISKLLLSGMD